MSSKLFIIMTVLVSLILTFAPVFAQDARDTNATPGTAVAADDTTGDDDRGPELGWLGLIGLVGLGGLMRRERANHDRTDRAAHR
jgi:MYXO-CTERM domain-containing protein